MKRIRISVCIYHRILLLICASIATTEAVWAQRPKAFGIYQFPSQHIPSIDGDAADWRLIPDSLAIGISALVNVNDPEGGVDTANMDAEVKVAWVKGLNRLYFLYEAYDDYWNFAHASLASDIFELVIDGDRSGGPFIDRFHPDTTMSLMEAYFTFHGVHAQNYHIFTPPGDKDWAMLWGPQTWLKSLPYAQSAYTYHFESGGRGRLTLEFYITPFDFASADGPKYSVPSKLEENKTIGLGWGVIDYDNKPGALPGFWILGTDRTMYGNASHLIPFTLLPLTPNWLPDLQSEWSFHIDPNDGRTVTFHDESIGEATTWYWDFGDGSHSTEQHPLHRYGAPGLYVVSLRVSDGIKESTRTRIWDVAIRQ
ncbi:PKD domain-containing protein [Parapedobacter sp.]